MLTEIHTYNFLKLWLSEKMSNNAFDACLVIFVRYVLSVNYKYFKIVRELQKQRPRK